MLKKMGGERIYDRDILLDHGFIRAACLQRQVALGPACPEIISPPKKSTVAAKTPFMPQSVGVFN